MLPDSTEACRTLLWCYACVTGLAVSRCIVVSQTICCRLHQSRWSSTTAWGLSAVGCRHGRLNVSLLSCVLWRRHGTSKQSLNLCVDVVVTSEFDTSFYLLFICSFISNYCRVVCKINPRLQFFPRCIECQRILAMRKVSSVRPSVCLSNACIVTEQNKDLSRFLYHMKDHLA